MTLDIQFKLHSNPNYIKYIRENSIWYKILNRNPEMFNSFVEEMKEKYRLRPSDKFNDVVSRLEMVSSLIGALK